MTGRLKWYQLLRIWLPLVYTTLIITGLFSKNIAIILVLMGTALLGGAYFCGWLCPFGFIQEMLGNLGRLLKIPRIRLSIRTERILKFTRYVLFGLSLTGIGFIHFILSPYGSMLGVLTRNVAYITSATGLFLGVFLVLSLFMDRPFCRYFCSEGARYGMISLARIFTIRRDKDKCVSCGKCSVKCPVQINVSNKKKVRHAQCINCFECIAACPVKGTLTYGWAFNKENKDREVTENESA